MAARSTTPNDALAEFIRQEAAPKVFRTGSVGFYAGGKLNLDGKRYQVTASFVEIGSKQR